MGLSFEKLYRNYDNMSHKVAIKFLVCEINVLTTRGIQSPETEKIPKIIY